MWRNMFRLGLLFSLLLLLAPQPADSQVLNRLKKRAAQAAEDQLSQEIEEMIRGAVRCVFDDLECVERARADGQKVVLTDAEGEIMMNDEGQPYMDPSELPPEMAPTPPPASNYDFEPGDRVIFETSFAGDNFGDFPRVLEFLQGNMQVVDWQGQAFLQADQKESRFAIQLPETLPERFTIEFDLYDPTDGEGVSLALTEPPNLGWAWAHYYEGYQFLNAGRSQGSGVWQGGEGTPRVSTTVDSQTDEGFAPVRIMVDGEHAKMFIGERRVANIPVTTLGRSDKIYFFMEPRPPELTYIGNIRIAAGGRALYDALDADGRVAVHGILFDTGEATIRTESAVVLEEIGRMLQDHADLSLLVEGHTDNQGEFDYNMTLSADRAAAVKAYLVETYGIDAERLRTMGLGPSQPVADNDTPEGMQQNRRVELVKIG